MSHNLPFDKPYFINLFIWLISFSFFKIGSKINNLVSFDFKSINLFLLNIQKAFIQRDVNMMNDMLGMTVDVLRLDVIDEVISGNKWFKLKKYIENARKLDKKFIVTFGGAFSNHIVATAAACRLNKLNSVGIIRGEEPLKLSHTLIKAKEEGMKIVFISREDYRAKKIAAEFLTDEYYLVNEGGYGLPGAEGIANMLMEFDTTNYSDIFCAVGTGTMMAGLIKASLPDQQITGIPVLKNMPGIEHEIKALLTPQERSKTFNLLDHYHFNGYAKYSGELINFMNDFYDINKIPTDFVYTGKLFYGVSQFTNQKKFDGKRVLIIHSGGLQGNLSLPKGKLMF